MAREKAPLTFPTNSERAGGVKQQAENMTIVYLGQAHESHDDAH